MLKIENLHAAVADKPILKGLSLSLNAGEIHAIMGPNGAGKSTLSYVLGGRPGYEVTEGSVTFTAPRHAGLDPASTTTPPEWTPDQVRGDEEGEAIDLLALDPHERAAAGLFLGFQYPVEIPGVSNVQFLRESLNAQRKARGEEPLSGGDFLKLAREKAALLKMDMDMLKRPVNVGFSGGEKKRNEMVQMGILDPKLAILDETDSGLDIDALRIVGDGINSIMRRPDKAVLLITHYQRLLDYVRPDFVHVLAAGRIVKSGGPELALELERDGYAEIAGVILSLALLAMAQATEPAPTDEEIVVIARRMNEISVNVGRDPRGRYHCSLSASTGLRHLDDRLCKTVTNCVRKGAANDAAIKDCVAASKPKLIEQLRREAGKRRS